MTFLSRIRWVVSILLVFLIVLITNLVDKDNFNRLSYSVTTMYEDKIVAKDLIFEMSWIIRENQMAIISNDTITLKNDMIESVQEMNSLIERYKQTKLTTKEQLVFTKLQDDLLIFEQQEQFTKNIQNGELLKSIDKINQHLHELSKIQLEEGYRQVAISNRVKDTVKLFTQVEIIFLILMAIFIQIVIFYRPRRFDEE